MVHLAARLAQPHNAQPQALLHLASQSFYDNVDEDDDEDGSGGDDYD